MKKINEYYKNMLNLADIDIHMSRLIKNVYMLNMKQRWSLYFSWVKTAKEMYDRKILCYEELYTKAYEQYKELKELKNIEIFNKMHVMALTTTGAAENRIMLESLKSPIGTIWYQMLTYFKHHILSTYLS